MLLELKILETGECHVRIWQACWKFKSKIIQHQEMPLWNCKKITINRTGKKLAAPAAIPSQDT
jgi:hypothetical protein